MKGKKQFAFDDQPPASTSPRSKILDLDEDLTLGVPAVPETGESNVRLARFDPPPRLSPLPEVRRPGLAVYWLAALASALWVGGMLGVALAYERRLGFFDFDGFALAVFLLIALAPIGLIWLAIHTLRQGSAFVGESRRAKDYAERMLEPAALSAVEAGSMVESIRGQVERAIAAAAQARSELTQLHDSLAAETDRLLQSAAASTHTAAGLIESLGRERQQLAAVTDSLGVQAQGIGEAITRHARMVADASDLAQAQIGEAEASLAARAADLTAAAGQAGSAARLAGEDLARQTARLETAGAAVGDQIQIVEDALGQQRAALVAAAHGLRADHEDLALTVEAQRAELADILVQGGEQAGRLGDVAAEGARTLRDLAAEAADQFREIADTAQAERDLLGATALQSLGAFSEAAAFERRAMEEQSRLAVDALQAAAEAAHHSAEASSEAARQKIDQLAESAFAAGQKADAVFEARLGEARSLIESTAQLVDDAGERSAARLDHGIGQARAALADLEQGLGAIEGRSARLPQEAAARAAEIVAAIEQANEKLLDSARQAAAETQAIDQAFQDRIKRNYEMLSEAVRLMGVIGGGASARASGGGVRPSHLRPAAAPVEPADGSPRPRLKLTPAPPDEGDGAIFDPSPAVSPPSGGEDDEWTWKDLLGAADASDAATDAPLAERLIQEIDALGIEPLALLPKSRIDEVVAALNAGKPASAREIVRRVAPAAIRRLSRRVLSDKVLRAQSDRFVQSFHSLVREARQPGSEVSLHTLLGDDAGRAYLLLDAAVGELG